MPDTTQCLAALVLLAVSSMGMPGGNGAEDWVWALQSIYRRGEECFQLYLNIQNAHRENFTSTGQLYLSLSSILTFVFNVEYLVATLSSTCLLDGDPVTNAGYSDIDVMAVFEGPFFLGAKRLIWGVNNVWEEEWSHWYFECIHSLHQFYSVMDQWVWRSEHTRKK